MPIITNIENGYRPAFICDHCGREIERAEHGNVWYSLEKEGPVFFSHREKACNDAGEAQFHPGLVSFFNLDTWLVVHVLNNLQPVFELGPARRSEFCELCELCEQGIKLKNGNFGQLCELCELCDVE